MNSELLAYLCVVVIFMICQITHVLWVILCTIGLADRLTITCTRSMQLYGVDLNLDNVTGGK